MTLVKGMSCTKFMWKNVHKSHVPVRRREGDREEADDEQVAEEPEVGGHLNRRLSYV